ncbi:hypothetical protein [Actinophytocola oryzae]|uniref:Lipoprotein n=1 Tax=Actinophytocola oryzae TaxID=502181 RepID=A0A4R7V6I2_9PSEU|nr:hypothetical protein [Actinophytocola oryzae]TDV44297.1 hypothetical protein CLV71_114207 [Actinophytocola oryzae]
MLKPAVILLCAGLVLAGCSNDDAGDESGLLSALGQVRATPETRKAVEYGEPAAVRALLAEDRDRYQLLQGFGYGTIASYAIVVGETLSLHLDEFDSAISVGQPPKQATVLWGKYDVAAVDGKLRGLGIDGRAADDATRWRAADDYEIDLANGPFADLAPTPQLNDILTRDWSFAFAPAAAGIDWVTDAGDETLAGDDVLASLARCLGDVVAAQLQATRQAVGVREDGTQLICLDGDRARVSDALDGDMPSTARPWHDVLPGAEVTEDGDLVRVTVPPPPDDTPVGQVMRVMQNGDLDGLR